MINTKVKTFLEKVIGPGEIKSKNNVAFRCPFCHHHKNKLEIKLDSNDESFGFWHCWVCNKSGNNLFSLLRKTKIDQEYLNILGGLIGKKQISRQKVNIFDQEPEKIQINYLPNEFKPLFIKTKQPEYKHAIHYMLNKRNLTGYDLLRYNIGYCESGKYAGRIIIPSYDSEGRLNFFVARTFIDHENTYDTPPWNRNIVGFELFINWKEPIILTEGVFDAMTIGRNAIPLFGKFLSEKLKRKIFEEETKQIIIALDSDARKDTVLMAEYLINQGIDTYLLDMKEKDPNVIGRKKMLDLIQSATKMTPNEILKIKIMERIS